MNDVQGRLTHRVDRNLRAVTPVALAVRAYAEPLLNESCVASVELALVEALTNAIKHGTIRMRAQGQIIVTAHVEDNALVIEVRDTASSIPEDLLIAASAKSLEVDVDDISLLEEGGRGLSIIVLSMDEVTLHTANDQYVLRMVKYLDGERP